MAERLIAQAARAPDAAERARALRSALALWRSRALADLTGLAWFDTQAERIERLRADTFGSLVDARLGLGEHAALVPELEELAGRHPFDEALHAQLMLALYRSGRQADAFDLDRQCGVSAVSVGSQPSTRTAPVYSIRTNTPVILLP